MNTRNRSRLPVRNRTSRRQILTPRSFGRLVPGVRKEYHLQKERERERDPMGALQSIFKAKLRFDIFRGSEIRLECEVNFPHRPRG